METLKMASTSGISYKLAFSMVEEGRENGKGRNGK